MSCCRPEQLCFPRYMSLLWLMLRILRIFNRKLVFWEVFLRALAFIDVRINICWHLHVRYELSSFWNVEILSWGVHRWCLFTDKGFLDCSGADCDFKKFFFFLFSDCPYLLLTTSLVSCVHLFSCVFLCARVCSFRFSI